jgi:AcrR family transcriptional regulator
VRAAADIAGTTTRAVYSVFGSKDGLLAGLALRAYELLGASIARLPVTDDPAHDLVEAAVKVFRAMAISNPAAYRITFMRAVPDLDFGPGSTNAARESFALLQQRVERLDRAGGLAGRTVMDATIEFNAMCEGLAAVELRDASRLGGRPERVWRRSISTLVNGFAVPARDDVHAARPTRRRRR